MHFGENQLSRSLIGLSPLTTGHPLSFQPKWVRSSTPSYRRFNLPMARSLRFGSRPGDCIALFGLAFATASPHGLTSRHATNSQAHSSKGTPSPLLGRLRRIVGTRFQVLFHSPPGVLFTFPSRYLSTIGHSLVFSLGRWSSRFRTGYHVSRPTHFHAKLFRIRGSHPLWPAFPCRSPYLLRALGLLPFRSPLLRKCLLMSFPRGTEMFHFSRFATHHYVFMMRQCSAALGFPIRISRTVSALTASSGLFAG